MRKRWKPWQFSKAHNASPAPVPGQFGSFSVGSETNFDIFDFLTQKVPNWPNFDSKRLQKVAWMTVPFSLSLKSHILAIFEIFGRFFGGFHQFHSNISIFRVWLRFRTFFHTVHFKHVSHLVILATTFLWFSSLLPILLINWLWFLILSAWVCFNSKSFHISTLSSLASWILPSLAACSLRRLFDKHL